ncbi:hypothetical protein GCM10007424_04010 [Flavobacterium suaedae]|uniref:DUF3300 domain-containing protein n=2 Tax=Flavobacterium suaedae TaxID=1767027 RepID=A0ABQ1JHE6_9FLAO|nr:hypothetical protein GCM10007424_04010 [Flavobacterium suaedae]
MKYIALFALLFVNQIFAQDVTTVTANSYDISDNLDLKAVASIFGESRDLEDFEKRLNDPNIQISNLDLNGDNRVDYLRVIEVVENNTHLIILQSVLGINQFQDVATIEVERDRYNNVQVQVVGDVYMYGTNYIYEPVYVTRPLIYDVFWASSYRPYYSPWYWGYYPTYYSYWNPYPVYRYRRNIHIHINNRNTYHYVSTRRSSRAVAMHSSRRSDYYERTHPNRSFNSRTSATNRYALVQRRGNNDTTTRATTTGTTRNSYTTSGRNSNTTNNVRNSNINHSNVNSSRSNNSRATTPARTTTTTRRSNTTTSGRNSSLNRSGSSSRQNNNSSYSGQRSNTPSRNSSPSMRSGSSRSSSSSPRVRTSTPSPSRSGSSTRSSRGQ